MVKTILLTPPTDAPPRIKRSAVRASDDKLKDRKELRAKVRESRRLMIPMAALDTAQPVPIKELRFVMVRCVDESPGGLGIVLPRSPKFREACFRITRGGQTVHLAAQVRDVVEDYCERRHQFRIGFQFTAVLSPDGTLDSMPATP